jgi:hypothetical protein
MLYSSPSSGNSPRLAPKARYSKGIDRLRNAPPKRYSFRGTASEGLHTFQHADFPGTAPTSPPSLQSEFFLSRKAFQELSENRFDPSRRQVQFQSPFLKASTGRRALSDTRRHLHPV